VESKNRIVVVEQGEVICHLIARYLDSAEAIRVATREEAAQIVESQAAIALCINEMPISLPDARMAQRALRMAFDVPIFSCWVPEPSAGYSQMGVQDYLIKPVTRADLLSTVERVAPQAHTILLVDDDAEARQLFGRVLTSAGRDYLVAYADDGAAALSLLRERRPDLLLLDLVMPNVDGFAVLEAKARDPELCDVPVIILSAKDPQREPIITKNLSVARENGLSARDLMLSLEALTQVLRPRFGVGAQPEKRTAPPACG
jgi:CheY-like chemotaxis protein